MQQPDHNLRRRDTGAQPHVRVASRHARMHRVTPAENQPDPPPRRDENVMQALPEQTDCWRVPIETDMTPETAVLSLRDDRRPFALAGDWFDGLSILGSEPLLVADPATDDPFELFDQQPTVMAGDRVVVGGGWVGWLGYQLGARVEQLPPTPPAPAPRAEFSLAFYDHVVVFDGQRWWFEALASPEREQELQRRLRVWRQRLSSAPELAAAGTSTFRIGPSGAAGHLAAVTDCRERIGTGELFQANLTVRLEAEVEGNLLDLFSRALPVAKPRFGALIDGTLSLSPERFLRRIGRSVSTEPIKGTRPRVSGDDATDPAFAELLHSAKDAAEHVMIVDLMRNDLGRVCEYGSVQAQPVRGEPHAGVWHLVSTVRGELREEVRDADLLQRRSLQARSQARQRSRR